jgi:hypothetical protein
MKNRVCETGAHALFLYTISHSLPVHCSGDCMREIQQRCDLAFGMLLISFDTGRIGTLSKASAFAIVRLIFDC